MMWPFKRHQGTGRKPKESELAMEAAKHSLRESMSDRAEVREVSRVVHHELSKNHISQRITVLLKEGR